MSWSVVPVLADLLSLEILDKISSFADLCWAWQGQVGHGLCLVKEVIYCQGVALPSPRVLQIPVPLISIKSQPLEPSDWKAFKAAEDVFVTFIFAEKKMQ